MKITFWRVVILILAALGVLFLLAVLGMGLMHGSMMGMMGMEGMPQKMATLCSKMMAAVL